MLLVAILFRVWVTPGTRSTSARLLACALLATLAADIVYNVSLFTTSAPLSTPWNDTLWLLGYLLLATATSWPRGSDDPPAHVAGSRAEPVRSRTQLVALTGGLLLPAVALLVDGADDGPVQWAVIGVGSVVLSLLVPARMAALLRVVEVQSVQLAALARSDSLTGAPNRRTWDHELSRACQRARDGGEPLSIALLDLDRFKLYNDAHGHQAGDLLLREAVARWTDLLEAGDLLARYGGEEFAVLMPGRSLGEARARLDRLREATPSGQTFSAGVAVWDPATEPADALRLADEALYDAKRSGRDQVRVSGRVAPAPRLPVPVAVLQPIVDLRTGVMVAMEALSRFDGESSVAAFERAQREGLGPELEAAAMRAALLCRPAEVVMTLNVSLAALVHPAIVAALPADLHGITLEITRAQRRLRGPEPRGGPGRRACPRCAAGRRRLGTRLLQHGPHAAAASRGREDRHVPGARPRLGLPPGDGQVRHSLGGRGRRHGGRGGRRDRGAADHPPPARGAHRPGLPLRAPRGARHLHRVARPGTRRHPGRGARGACCPSLRGVLRVVPTDLS